MKSNIALGCYNHGDDKYVITSVISENGVAFSGLVVFTLDEYGRISGITSAEAENIVDMASKEKMEDYKNESDDEHYGLIHTVSLGASTMECNQRVMSLFTEVWNRTESLIKDFFKSGASEVDSEIYFFDRVDYNYDEPLAYQIATLLDNATTPYETKIVDTSNESLAPLWAKDIIEHNNSSAVSNRVFKGERTLRSAFTVVSVEGNNPTIDRSNFFDSAPEEDEAEEIQEITLDSDQTSFVRPNGEVYLSRSIFGHSDVSLLRHFAANNQFAQLVGPPGSGKTAMVEAAFPNVISIKGHNDMIVSHLVGGYSPNRFKGQTLEDGSIDERDWIWSDGPLTTAMKEGRTLLVDEATRIPSGTLDILVSATDGRGVISLDDLPGAPEVKAAPGFYVVLSYNPETITGRALDDAINSRFGIKINVETDYTTLAPLEIPETAIRIAIRMQEVSQESQANSGGRGYWLPQIRELLFFKNILKMGLGEVFALNNLYSQCPDKPSAGKLRDVIAEVTQVQVSELKTEGII